jgi:hypothetical protein
MKTLRSTHYFFKELTQFAVLKNVIDPLASNINDSLTRATVLLPFTWMEWFCKKVIFWPMKTLRVRQYSLKQQTQFTVLNKVLDPLASNINDSLPRATVLLPFTWMGGYSQKLMFSPMKTLRGGQYSFQKLSQYTMLNKVLDPLASNINDLLRKGTVFLHSLQRGYFAQS